MLDGTIIGNANSDQKKYLKIVVNFGIVIIQLIGDNLFK